ncbi:MAG: 6-bladed beta-propeller [Tannerella sp.]|jgi:hypothetical protein|nr:6-bladed beta-propeller [Tannerella sp.]
MKYNILAVSACFAFLCCCNDHPAHEHYNAEHVIDINNPPDISIDDFIIDMDTIRLETTDESLMKEADRVHIMDDRFYILTNDYTEILIFNLKGKFIAKIHDKGQGPDEYIRINSFMMDPVKKRIIIADSFSKRIFIYDRDGKQNRVINLDLSPEIIILQGERFINVYSGSKQRYTNPEMENYNIHFLDSQANFVSSAIKTEIPRRIDIYSPSMIDCLENGDILFQPLLGNVVYKIAGDSISAYYEFNNLSKYKLPTKDLKNDFEYAMVKGKSTKMPKEKEDEGYLLTWGNVHNLNDYLFFHFGWDKKRFLYYEKKTSRSLLIDPESVKGDKNLIKILFSYPKGIKGNRFYVSPSHFLINEVRAKITNGKIRTFLDNTGIDGNPVIISFSIKFPEDRQ